MVPILDRWVGFQSFSVRIYTVVYVVIYSVVYSLSKEIRLFFLIVQSNWHDLLQL